jgi:hypothetical protein
MTSRVIQLTGGYSRSFLGQGSIITSIRLASSDRTEADNGRVPGEHPGR